MPGIADMLGMSASAGTAAGYGTTQANAQQSSDESGQAAAKNRAAVQGDMGQSNAWNTTAQNDYGAATGAGQAGMNNSLGMLAGAANGTAPSQAAALMQSGLDQSARQQMAMAGGSRGGPLAAGLAQYNAAQSGANAQQAGVQQQAALRANEMATARGQLSQGEQANMQQLQNQEQISGTMANNQGNLALGQGQLALGSQGQNDALQGQFMSNAMQGQQLATQGQIANQQAQTQVNLANAAANGQLVGGALGAAGGLAMMSDKRAKTEIRALDDHDFGDRRPFDRLPSRDLSSYMGDYAKANEEHDAAMAPDANAIRSTGTGASDADYQNADDLLGVIPNLSRVAQGATIAANTPAHPNAAPPPGYPVAVQPPPELGVMSHVGNAFTGAAQGMAANRPRVMSDKRTKESLGMNAGPLDEMHDAIHPASWKYKDDRFDPSGDSGRERMGVMADDLAKTRAGRSVLDRTPEGLLAINVPAGVSTLFAGQAALHDRISALEKRGAR